jgi:hypothetical protein
MLCGARYDFHEAGIGFCIICITIITIVVSSEIPELTRAPFFAEELKKSSIDYRTSAEVIRGLPIFRMIFAIRAVVRVTIMGVTLIGVPLTVLTLIVAGLIASLVDPLIPIFIVGSTDQIGVPYLSVCSLSHCGGVLAHHNADDGGPEYQEVFPPIHFSVEFPGEDCYCYERN